MNKEAKNRLDTTFGLLAPNNNWVEHPGLVIISSEERAGLLNSEDLMNAKEMDRCTFCGKKAYDAVTKNVNGYIILDSCETCEEEILEPTN